ncbi:hypothetical protein BH09PSE1_BH09PSE1_14310 [soil metagenome]
MFTVLDCLHQHDPRLLVWAALICIVCVGASLTAYRLSMSKQGTMRWVWLAIVGLMMGNGVWATHFMAMLAFQRRLEIDFGLDLTALSGLLAILGLGGGFALCANSEGWRGRSCGGALCGLAIGAMHFSAVAAMRLPAEIAWHWPMAAVAVGLGTASAAAAMVTAGAMTSSLRAFAAGALFVFAICSVHFVGMAAVTLTPDMRLIGAPGLFDRHQLAVGVGVLSALVTMAGTGIMAIDRFGVQSALANLRSALNQTPSAIAFFDARGQLMLWNEGYVEILVTLGLRPIKGLQLETILSRVASDPSQRARLHTDLPPTRLPDGRWLQPAVATLKDGGLALVLTDISDQLALTALEVEARRLAEAASRAKSDFLANVGHELRTPLNAILGMVQVGQRDPAGPRESERLEIIGAAGEALLAIIESVLDIAEIEAGSMTLDTRPFDLVGALDKATAAAAAACQSKDLAFRLDVTPDAVGDWLGDGPRLGQIIANLTANAVKFTDHGEVSVDVRCRHAGGLTFEVVDTGMGIPDDKLGVLFETFTQADSSASRCIGGIGLGLPICRSLVAMMGGELEVFSQPGRGSIFRFSLDLPRTAEAGLPGPPAVMEPEEEPLRILAAEDNAANRLVLAALLEPFGVELRMVEDGAAAVDAYIAGSYDLILMDIQMPGMDGVKATREIRRLEGLSGSLRLPIIAVTANAMPQQVREYRLAGMDACVAKPIDAHALLQAIQAAVEGRGSADPVSAVDWAGLAA